MKSILFICLLSLFLCDQLTTRDPAFEEKFKVKHHQDGDGKTFAAKGDRVHVHYTGTLLDGKKFDSSHDRSEPLPFSLGLGQVIKCWDLAVARLSLNEKITVTCPSDLAYGSRGAGSVIPPNSDLIFEMELMKIEPKPTSSDL